MSSSLAGFLQIVLLVIALAVCYKPLGDYIARIFTSDKHLKPELAFYRVMGIDPEAYHPWGVYARSVLRLLLALSVVGGIILMATGVIDNFNLTHVITTLVHAPQTMVGGPIASQEAIKELGNNGGGFFNANSAHPFENPNPFSNWLQMLSIFAIPAGLTYTLGRMTGSQRHGWAGWGAIAALFLCGVTAGYLAEARGQPLLHGVD